MDKRLIIGWALNAIWLLHLVFKNKSGGLNKSIAIMLLSIPYLGFIFYFIFYVWDVPRHNLLTCVKAYQIIMAKPNTALRMIDSTFKFSK